MPVTTLAELREALREAEPGDTIDLAPGEYAGPILIDKPLTLRGRDRKTVLWRRGGPVIYIQSAGVTLERLHIERTVQAEGPLVIHNAECIPTGRDSMQVDTLISLGDLIPGVTVTLPLEIEVAAPVDISTAGLQGLRITPSSLKTPGKHLLWLTLDGKSVVRGEMLLGEISLTNATSKRYLWASGVVLDAPAASEALSLASKKLHILPSAGGMLLDASTLALLDTANFAPGNYAFLQRDAGGLSLHLPGKPPQPISVNGVTMPPMSRLLLRQGDTVKIGNLALTVQPAEAQPFTLQPPVIQFQDFDEQFPEVIGLTIANGRTAWKGRAVPTVPWLEVIPDGDFRVPPSRSHTWTVQLNAEALTLANGPHDAASGILVIGAAGSVNSVIGIDTRINVRRPEVALQLGTLDVGSVEWGYPVERSLSLSIGNLGYGAWTGTVTPGVPWLEVVTPMPITCGPWTEIAVDVHFVAAWEQLSVGRHEIPNALTVSQAAKDGEPGVEPANSPVKNGQNVTALIDVLPAAGHLTPLSQLVEFDKVERNAPLPDATVQVHNDGGGVWTGTARALNGWVRVRPEDLSVEPGATVDVEIDLLDTPADLELDTPVLLDEVQFADTSVVAAVSVRLSLIELPPYLVASPVSFAPFVKGDTPPDGTLRLYNTGPSRWKGSLTANVDWLTVPDSVFTCEPGASIELTVTLNSRAPAVLPIGFSQWDDALSISGGREPVSVAVAIDQREAISEIHLDTPTLNFGRIDGTVADMPTQLVRLVNASPAPWTGKVELCVPWLSLRSSVRAFDLEIPKQSIAEFAVTLDDSVRWATPGTQSEDQAIRITGKGQALTIAALFSLVEWSPLLSVAPEKMQLTDDAPQTVTVHNTGSRPWPLRVIAAPWLNVSPADFTLEPGRDQPIEVRRAADHAEPPGIDDPRAIVIAGPGREVGVEVGNG